MVKSDRNNLFIPQLIRLMAAETDSDQITRYENKMACMLASPILTFAAILNFLYHLPDFENNLESLLLNLDKTALINSSLFLFFAVLFEIIQRARIKNRWASFYIGVLYIAWFLFVLIRLYPMVGYAVWMLGCLQIIIAMGRTSNKMALYLAATLLASGGWVFLHQDMYYYQTTKISFLIQGVLILLTIIVTAMMHKINIGRYLRIQEQNLQMSSMMTNLKENEQSLLTLATIDQLTDLPNRRWFIESLDEIIKAAGRKEEKFYIVFIDMDSFKKINDTMGHDKGDIFLKETAARLKESIHESDLLGRIGGDEFGLVINRNISKKEVYREVERIQNKFDNPIRLKSSQITLSASFGIAGYPKDGTTSEELLRYSDISMYKAKSLGKNRIRFFSRTLMEDLVYKSKMEDRLKKAIANNELYLVFQPQYNIRTSELRGFEALLRWESEDFGLVPPMEFIGLAEQRGLIIPLGEWVIREAFRSHARFKDVYKRGLTMSINISLAQITDRNFLKLITNCVNEYLVTPSEIEFEVTESIFAETIEQTVQVLKELKKDGFGIALDDFGTGYSSISYLKSFPIDTLKIDRSFTCDLTDDQDNRSIVQDLIALGHDLDAVVLVEGIEHDYQLNYLKDVGCDYGQGFFLGKPMKDEAIFSLLSTSLLSVDICI